VGEAAQETLERGLERGRALANAGHKAEAVAHYVASARSGVDDRVAALLLCEAVPLARWVHGADRAVDLADSAVERGARAGGAAEVRAFTLLGDALLWAGRYAEAGVAWERAALVEVEADAMVLADRADALLRGGDLAAARETAYEAVVLAREAGGDVLVDALGLACCAEIHSGSLREALACAEQAVAATSTDGGVPYLDALGLVAWVTALTGDVDRCRNVLAMSRSLVGGLPMTAPGGLAEGLLELGLGHYDLAARALETKFREQGLPPVGQACGPRPFVGSLAEALARVGRTEEARRLVDEILAAARDLGHPRLIAPALRAKGTVEEDEDAFGEALSWHERWGNLLEEGRTHLALGELLRRRKRRDEARHALRAALERFEHVGAATWALRASAELRASGERSFAVPVPAAPGPVSLTQQEAAVIELLAAGLSNRELAAQLYLSVKTVEGHLTTIYDKYGVRSRGQLLAVLARDRE
jgi:DNA-binding CsgD family transcriptional regulator